MPIMPSCAEFYASLPRNRNAEKEISISLDAIGTKIGDATGFERECVKDFVKNFVLIQRKEEK